jgi:hypothetical protein
MSRLGTDPRPGDGALAVVQGALEVLAGGDYTKDDGCLGVPHR